MQKSLAMLVNVVDYEDKKLQLEGLKNRLEAMASPKLVQAFNTGNLGTYICSFIIFHGRFNFLFLIVSRITSVIYIYRPVQSLRGYFQQNGKVASTP